MMSEERYLGWRFHEVRLPDGGRIILLYCWDGSEPDLSAYDGNHNIFRLTPQGEVVWQVVRTNEWFKETWEERLARLAQEKYPHHLPFMGLCLADPDYRDENGYAQCLPDETSETGYSAARADKPLVWRPGTMLLAFDVDGHQYDVDVDTGIAKNITPFGHRPW